MKSHAKEEFIQLRAKGLSFDKISNELNISKPTLLKWNEELEKEIANCSYLEIEAILEQYRLMKLHKIEIFSLILEKSIEELKKRDFSNLSTKDLYNLIFALETKLQKELENYKLQTNQPLSLFEEPKKALPLFY